MKHLYVCPLRHIWVSEHVPQILCDHMIWTLDILLYIDSCSLSRKKTVLFTLLQKEKKQDYRSHIQPHDSITNTQN